MGGGRVIFVICVSGIFKGEGKIMDKSKQLVGFGAMLFFLIMGVISISVFAQGKPDEILTKLETIQQTLDSQVIPRLDQCCGGVPKTGQTESYAPGDDGDLQMGIPWPFPRFTDNEDGTVTDNLTHLMWTKNAQQISGIMTWYAAVNACNDLIFADYEDWRLPNAKELLSLIDYSQDQPVLPIDHPFTNEMPESEDYPSWNHYWWCWSSTKQVYHSNYANIVGLGHGEIGGAGRNSVQWVWAVRGGNP